MAWALSIRSPVSTTACGSSAFTERTAASSTCALNASWGRKAAVSGGPRRSSTGSRAGDSSSPTCGSESWAKVAMRAPRRGGGRELGAVAQRLAGRGRQRAVAVGVPQGGVERRAGHRRLAGAAGGERNGGEERGEHRGDPVKRSHRYSARSPATTGSRATRRPTHADAAAATPTRPIATTAIAPGPATSGSAA